MLPDDFLTSGVWSQALDDSAVGRLDRLVGREIEQSEFAVDLRVASAAPIQRENSAVRQTFQTGHF